MFNLFGRKKKLGVVYYVNVADIKIQPSFEEKGISEEKYQKKLEHYLRTGEFESTVYLSQRNVLVDGYSTYLIAKQFNMGKIPAVYGAF